MEPLDTWSDERLLADRARPSASFSIFYRRHVTVVLAFCARQGASAAEAADVAAETFVAALVARHRYEPQRSTARPWLLGIANRTYANTRRRRAREHELQQQLALQPAALTEADEAAYADLASQATKALQDLPEAQRRAIQGRVVEGKTYSRISRELQVSEGAARQHVSRGLSALRLHLPQRDAKGHA